MSLSKEQFKSALKDPWQYNLRKGLEKIRTDLSESSHLRYVTISEMEAKTIVTIAYRPTLNMSTLVISNIFEKHLNIDIDAYGQNGDTILYADLTHEDDQSILRIELTPK
jgi:hypothetical protein